MRDRACLPAAGGKAAVRGGPSREELPLPGLLQALPPFEDVSSCYKTNSSNILELRVLNGPVWAWRGEDGSFSWGGGHHALLAS